MSTNPAPAPTAAEREDYLIWSYEHNAWWKPNRCGYTADLLDAGLYRRVEALAIEANANRCSAEPHELAIPVRDRARTLQHIVERAQRMLAAIEPDSAALASAEQARRETATADDLHEAAWGLLANVSGGDWSRQSAEWQDAVARWRDRYHAALSSERETATLAERVARAQAALREYAGHKHWCEHYDADGAQCTCGYDNALHAVADAVPHGD